MRFFKANSQAKRTILVISDLHLGAGAHIEGKRNLLEDFESDQELVEFFDYFSKDDYYKKDLEIVINGDFLDLLAVPYVPFFDDEFWCEEASLMKLDLILKAHPEVFDSMERFLCTPNKKITYIIGNHDGEMIFDSLKEKFLNCFSEKSRSSITLKNSIQTYCPVDGVAIEHGHNYEVAHRFEPDSSIHETKQGKKYFLPAWGAYYVTHIINKYKQERDHVNAVRPISKFLIHGLIYDTLFTLRFMIANAYFFIMVRVIALKRKKLKWSEVLSTASEELELFRDYETLARGFFNNNPDKKLLIVGHTHEPIFREFADGKCFINTGTWTKMISLDLDAQKIDHRLSFAMIEDFEEDKLKYSLNSWSPIYNQPFIPQ